MATRIQNRRGTAAQWTAANPVLADGEPGVERDTGKVKHGDGSTPWNALPYSDATKADDTAVVKLTGAQAIAGTKTFATRPKVGTDDVALAPDVAAKADDNAVVKVTGGQTVGGLKNFTTRPTVGGTGVLLVGEGGGALTLNNRGDYTTARATSATFAVGDAFDWDGGRYLVATAFTGSATPDLSKTVFTGLAGTALAGTFDFGAQTVTFVPPGGGTFVVSGTYTPPDNPNAAVVSYVKPAAIPGLEGDLVSAIPDVVATGAIAMTLLGDDTGTFDLKSRLHSPGAGARVELKNLRMVQSRSDLDPSGAGYAIVAKISNFGAIEHDLQYPILSIGSTTEPGSILDVGIHTLLADCDSSGALSLQFRMRPVSAFDLHPIASLGGLTPPAPGTGIITDTAVVTLIAKAAGSVRINGTAVLTGIDFTGGSHSTICFGGDIAENAVVRGQVHVHGMQVLLAPTTQQIIDAEAALA